MLRRYPMQRPFWNVSETRNFTAIYRNFLRGGGGGQCPPPLPPPFLGGGGGKGVYGMRGKFVHGNDHRHPGVHDGPRASWLPPSLLPAPVKVADLKIQFDNISDAVSLLSKFGFMPKEEDFNKYWMTYSWPQKVFQSLDDSAIRYKENRNRFQQELREDTNELTEDIQHLQMEGTFR